MKKIILSTVLLLTVCGIAVAYSSSDDVYFNTHSYIYHNAACEWARKCTVNCIWVKRSEAINRGGRPCKVCGG